VLGNISLHRPLIRPKLAVPGCEHTLSTPKEIGILLPNNQRHMNDLKPSTLNPKL